MKHPTLQKTIVSTSENMARKNINKQEDVVHALWEFAHDLQVSKNVNTSRADGTKVDLDAVEKALRSILATFNVEITEVQ